MRVYVAEIVSDTQFRRLCSTDLELRLRDLDEGKVCRLVAITGEAPFPRLRADLKNPQSRGVTHPRTDRLVTPQPPVVQICQSGFEPVSAELLLVVEFASSSERFLTSDLIHYTQ